MVVGLNWFNFYCDMDGVLTDFDRLFTEQTGLVFAEVEDAQGSEKAWGMIKGIHNFWLRLEPKPDMQELWDFIRPYRPSLLTSPGRHDTARAMLQKREWVDIRIGEQQNIIFASAKMKSQFARPNAVIIDDWPPTIERWAAAGGVAIHHKDAKTSIARLQEYLDHKPSGDVFDHL